MSRRAHDAGVDELGRDVGVDDTDDEGWDDDEGERGLLIRHDAETAKRRCSGVLSEVAESDGWRYDEEKG